MITSLDLFSGIGGLTIALKKVTIPLIFCDIMKASQKVIKNNIQRKLLPNVPFCTDIKLLDRSWLQRYTKKQPEMIVAGFPCIGFSSAGHRKGFKNEQSGLFYELLRVIDEFDIKYLFLENVPRILHYGMGVVVEELVVKRDFKIKWCLLSAFECGAPQKRTRWYCFAIKNGLDIPRIMKTNKTEKTVWPDEPPRMTIKKGANHTDRHVLLGNTVVPCAAKKAFEFLTGTHVQTEKTRPVKSTLVFPINGMIEPIGQKRYILSPIIRDISPKPDFKLTLDPTCYISPKPPNILLTREMVVKPVKLKLWGTPTSNTIGSANYLTERSKIALHTQIRFEKRTPNSKRRGWVSPEFVEWMMGYPFGWTRVAPRMTPFVDPEVPKVNKK
jgi:DNA-cytosine methyltransferase